MIENKLQKDFLLASIVPYGLSDQDAFEDLKELKSLVDAYGGKVLEFLIQNREVHDKGMYLGRGKLEEAAKIIKDKDIDVVVLNAVVKPGHIFEIKKILSAKKPTLEVWDRVDLILEIFSVHAHTAEAKLQIELARMRHMGPRIYGMGMVMSRQGGGIGTLGVGETNTELMKRHWRDQIKEVRDKIQKHTIEREKQLERRQRTGIPTVSIVGYTNAGKTSLFNLLTGKKNIVNNALFVTLDSSSGKLFLPKDKHEVLLTDTIGFIQNLPTSLIDAFKSTLMESVYSDVLLHVIDVSDEDMARKIAVVEQILSELGLSNRRKIYVFNKMDAASSVNREQIQKNYAQYTPQYISVKREDGIEELLDVINDKLVNTQ